MDVDAAVDAAPRTTDTHFLDFNPDPATASEHSGEVEEDTMVRKIACLTLHRDAEIFRSPSRSRCVWHYVLQISHILPRLPVQREGQAGKLAQHNQLTCLPRAPAEEQAKGSRNPSQAHARGESLLRNLQR